MGNLTINGLCQSFDRDDGTRLDVLNNLHLEVHDKEFVCILGASGCGKTTLLRLIAGLDEAKAGTIDLDGEEIRGPNPKVGFVFQEYSLFPWRNVIDNVAFGLEMRGISKEERYAAAKKYLGLVSLEQFSTSFPAELSGGMRQRVGCGPGVGARPGPSFNGRAVRCARCTDTEYAPERTAGESGKRPRRPLFSLPTVSMRRSTLPTGLSCSHPMRAGSAGRSPSPCRGHATVQAWSLQS